MSEKYGKSCAKRFLPPIRTAKVLQTIRVERRPRPTSCRKSSPVAQRQQKPSVQTCLARTVRQHWIRGHSWDPTRGWPRAS